MTFAHDVALRRSELAAGISAVEERIVRAARAAGRPRAELMLVAVSKTWPGADVRLLSELGLTEFAESRLQEATAKAAELTEADSAGPGRAIRWHFVGRLQRNKARAAARFAAVVHAVDRAELIAPLSRGAAESGRVLDVFVQVSLDGSVERGGAPPVDLPRLADAAAGAPALRLAGVMAVAPRGQDPRAAYARLRRYGEALREAHPGADGISAGMSQDLEDAIAEGATHLRIGSALFGSRA